MYAVGTRVMAILAIAAILTVLFIAFIVFLIRILIKISKNNSPTPTEKQAEAARVQQTLAEALKNCRTRCGMTQEYVAESLGISRQAVSKWENGTSEPSTSNLIALARLYGISVETLLQDVSPN